MPPLAQGRREAVVHDGAPLDTISACRDLTGAEEADLARRQAVAASALGRACEAARAAFIDERAEAAVAAGMPASKARAMAVGWASGVLRPGVVLHFDDAKIGEIDVAAILADPGKFEGEALADPIEGKPKSCSAKTTHRSSISSPTAASSTDFFTTAPRSSRRSAPPTRAMSSASFAGWR